MRQNVFPVKQFMFGSLCLNHLEKWMAMKYMSVLVNIFIKLFKNVLNFASDWISLLPLVYNTLNTLKWIFYNKSYHTVFANWKLKLNGTNMNEIL